MLDQVLTMIMSTLVTGCFFPSNDIIIKPMCLTNLWISCGVYMKIASLSGTTRALFGSQFSLWKRRDQDQLLRASSRAWLFLDRTKDSR